MSRPAPSRNAASWSRIAREDVPVGFSSGKLSPRAKPGMWARGLSSEQEDVRLERRVAAGHDLLAERARCRRASARRDSCSSCAPADPVRAAVRPVEADPVADRPAQQLVDRDAEGPRLDVEQRVLDRADRLLDDAARRRPPQRLHQRDVRLVGAAGPCRSGRGPGAR